MALRNSSLVLAYLSPCILGGLVYISKMLTEKGNCVYLPY